MILLEDKAYPVSDFVEREFVKGFHVYLRVRLAVFMHKVDTDVLCIFDESLFFLNKQVGVLGHALIDLLRVRSLRNILTIFSNCATPYETGVLEVLVGLFEVKELALQIERSHKNIMDEGVI